jgi:RimJ/RimL family protein N-acetyltransferase
MPAFPRFQDITPFESLTLEGSKVRLEPLAPRHLDGLCAAGLDESLWRWTLKAIRTREEMAADLDEAIRGREAGRECPFATVDRGTGRVIGSTRFISLAPEHRRVEIGTTWVGLADQRTGANIDAKWMMLRHAFEAWGCARVELKTDALNATSREAIRRLGAAEEGTLRGHMITSDGRIRDTVYYSILDREWPLVSRRLLARLGLSPAPAD